MTATHTPGPWHLAQNADRPVHVVAQGTWRTVAYIADRNILIDQDQREINANAALIAAAPVLLAAARRVVGTAADYLNAFDRTELKKAVADLAEAVRRAAPE
jgi:hypothetical protein